MTTTKPAEWIDFDKAIPFELRCEVSGIVIELRDFEPQLEALGRRVYDLKERLAAAIDTAYAEFKDAAKEFGAKGMDTLDGPEEILRQLAGYDDLTDRVLAMGGHLHAWTDCQARDPEWLAEIKKARGEEPGKLRM
jgi:hypothetical protein